MKLLHSRIFGRQMATSILAQQIVCPLLFLGAGLVVVLPQADADPIVFHETGSLATERVYHAQTVLTNGTVVVTGGFNQVEVFASGELYPPKLGTCTRTGSLNLPPF